jgi:(2Fe-2S) ferredoxin
MLCLWYVRKAWAENVVRKIANSHLRVEVLKGIATIMYTQDGSKGLNALSRAEQQFEELKIQFPMAKDFMDYFEKQWIGNMRMWVIGFRNILHAGQDTNAAVESYHANMKAIITSSRQRLSGHRMDWLVYHLTGDVLIHYWYVVQYKLYGFVTNKNAERVVASAILRSKDIPNHLVKLFPSGQDIV